MFYRPRDGYLSPPDPMDMPVSSYLSEKLKLNNAEMVIAETVT